MKRLLLTGIGGAIGVHVLAHVMSTTDWEVVGVDSFNHHGHYDRVTELCKDKPSWWPRIKMIRHDLTAPFTDRELNNLGHIDYIINLASLVVVGESVEDPVPFVRNNVELMLQVLELARKVKPEAFIQFSTDEVYGPAEGEAHKEWDPLIPSNPYSASKACQEMLCISAWRSYGLPLVITNTTNNFGEMGGPQKYSTIAQAKIAKGETAQIHASEGAIGSRFYIHSRNVADALLFILQRAPHLHEPGKADRPDRYNITGEKQVNNLELALKIASLMDKDLKYEVVNKLASEPGHDMHYGLDGSKLRNAGWRQPRTFEQSLEDSVTWHEENPQWLG